MQETNRCRRGPQYRQCEHHGGAVLMDPPHPPQPSFAPHGGRHSTSSEWLTLTLTLSLTLTLTLTLTLSSHHLCRTCFYNCFFDADEGSSSSWHSRWVHEA